MQTNHVVVRSRRNGTILQITGPLSEETAVAEREMTEAQLRGDVAVTVEEVERS